MDRHGFLAAFLLFLIVADVSNASFVVTFRKLVGLPPNDNSTNTTISPLPSPGSGDKDTKPNPTNGAKPGNEKPTGTQVPNSSSKLKPKGGSVSPAIGKPKESEKNHQGKDKNDGKTDSGGTVGNCDGSSNQCMEQKMVACIQSFESGSKEVVLLIQNEGESILKVRLNLTVPTSSKNPFEEVEIPKHRTERINVSLATVEGTKIVLNAGNGDCVLHISSPVSERNFSLRFASYSKLVTPIYGAYFLFLTALIVGGSWACCKFRKRRKLGGVQYQELEMGLPESVSAVDVETAEGWDQGWDDDWDEDKAVKSPGGRHMGNISGNGLTSRSPNRDGWENDWDD